MTVDWTLREEAKSHLRRMVRRLLKQYGYPLDKEEQAILTEIQQAELIAQDWAA